MYPQGKSILVIDTEAVRRLSTERALTEEGFAVTAVAEGFSAIRAARECRFALAVAAVRLPGMLDGITTLRLIRARQPSLRALFTGPAAGRPLLVDQDSDDFIPSPYQRRELLGCVFELLQRKGSARRDRGLAG